MTDEQIEQLLPRTVWVSAEEFEDERFIAVWTSPSAAFPKGLILLNQDHDLIHFVIDSWKEKRPELSLEQIISAVKEAYATIIATKVHNLITQEDSMRSPQATKRPLPLSDLGWGLHIELC